ncbi:MAG: hypothetical protein AAF518_28160 [Spirochaetota bacterium]
MNADENAELRKLLLESVLTNEQASEVLQGKLKDAWFVKLKIDLENKSGIVIFAVSKYKNSVLEIYSVFTNSQVNTRVRTFEDFTQITSHILEAVQDATLEVGISETLGRLIYRAVTPEVVIKQVSDWTKGDATPLVIVLEQAIQEEMRTKNIQIQADIESISSLDFRVNTPLRNKVSPIKSPFQQEESPTSPATTVKNIAKPASSVARSPADERVRQLSEGYERVYSCKTVLAPVRGIDFDKLQIGQKILFMLPFQTPNEKAMARKLGAVGKDGLNHPIVGEFLEIVEGGKSEFHIFAEGPHNSLLRAFEERPVKIAVPQEDQQSVKDRFRGASFWVHVAIAFTLILICFFVFFLNQG